MRGTRRAASDQDMPFRDQLLYSRAAEFGKARDKEAIQPFACVLCAYAEVFVTN